MGFGDCYYDERQLINIASERVVEMSESTTVTEVRDKQGKKIGYNLHTLDVDVTLNCKWSNGVMIGSLKPLIVESASLILYD